MTNIEFILIIFEAGLCQTMDSLQIRSHTLPLNSFVSNNRLLSGCKADAILYTRNNYVYLYGTWTVISAKYY